MYQHIAFDEMPNVDDSFQEEVTGIYQHETNYIDYGIYEDISKTIEFFNEIEKTQGDNFLDSHLMHVIDIGRPSNPLDEYSKNEACKEIYDMEQNEILQLNAAILTER